MKRVSVGKRRFKNFRNERIILLILMLIFVFSLFVLFLNKQGQVVKVTGNALQLGEVLVNVLGIHFLNITSPQNTTYNFSAGENYTLLMNVTSGFPINSLDYTLKDIKHNVEMNGNILNEEDSYSIGGYFDAYRFSNLLTVSGQDGGGQIYNDSVTFFVSLPNSAPLIQNLSNNVYVCENSYLSSFFTSYDYDEDNLNMDISPKYPFYVRPYVYTDYYRLTSEIYSGTLRKEAVGLYEETISLSDGQYSDSKKVNITVIEVNNAPIVQSIGVQTIWLVGENSTLNKTILVTDLEDGNQDSENLNFNISFQGGDLFNLTKPNSSLLYFNATLEDVGVYNISFCAIDNGLSSVHPNISICSQNGSSLASCINFSLTVTNENRAPEVISYFTENLSNVAGTEMIMFNITKHDPDSTIPDSYWYVDGLFVARYSESLIDVFNYTFGCGICGLHNITADITDGVLNASISQNFNVSLIACSSSSPGGGSSGGSGTVCISKLACGEWSTCQNLKNSIILEENYGFIKALCDKNGYDENNCGIQTRACTDLNNCTKNISKQDTLRDCFFTPNPSCSDGIKNCHGGSCEVLTDCGGPCLDCATCSDNILNQGEEKVDCGGPCPLDCSVETPNIPPSSYSPLLKNLNLAVIIISTFMIIYLVVKIYLIRKEKKRLIYESFKHKKK